MLCITLCVCLGGQCVLDMTKSFGEYTLYMELIFVWLLFQNPGACLYMQMDERLTCDGSHQHTRRLCPCA
jgi:hypothetical protein